MLSLKFTNRYNCEVEATYDGKGGDVNFTDEAGNVRKYSEVRDSIDRYDREVVDEFIDMLDRLQSIF